MSETLRQVLELTARQEVRISEHGYDELAADEIFLDEILVSLPQAIVVEDYPDYAKGPAVLVLQQAADGRPLHVVWGIAKGTTTPAVLVTAYRPDTARWSDDWMTRKR